MDTRSSGLSASAETIPLGVIDLNLYASIIDFLAEQDARGAAGEFEVAFDWVERLGLEREERNVVLHGIARLVGHPDGEGWERSARSGRLDTLAWTFHRAWIDRYGWEPTNKRGVERWNA
jgi:hypothetical protein